MLSAVIAVILGLFFLVWSADRFVSAAVILARRCGMPMLLVGMLVVGFGTSTPELFVSALSSLQGNPGLALGNAYGSNITNIGLILGLTAAMSPVAAQSLILRRELPILTAVTMLAAWQLKDAAVGRGESVLLLAVLAGVMFWYVLQSRRGQQDSLIEKIEELGPASQPLWRTVFQLVWSLVLLTLSSRALIWGAIVIAKHFGVSEIIIGLTIVALGTSLPELASSIVAIRKREHDIVLGNVLGSNLFNTLGVVGLAGVIQPMQVPAEVFSRDILVMSALTVSLFFICYGFRGRPGRVNRIEGGGLLLVYAAYTAYLVKSTGLL